MAFLHSYNSEVGDHTIGRFLGGGLQEPKYTEYLPCLPVDNLLNM
jgi:hypothetical protein